MSIQPFQRILAIKAAAAGPYVIIGRCFDCGSEQPLVNLPRTFAVSVAVCRRCRFTRTGVEDRRGLIQGTASVSRPPAGALSSGEAVVIRGLIPAVCPPPRPPGPVLTELTMTTVDEILAPWDDEVDDPESLTEEERVARAVVLEKEMEDLEAELDGILAELDRRHNRTENR